MADVAIVNASPLIILAKADHLDLLRHAADRVLVPDTVAQEIRAHPGDAAVKAIASFPWLHEVPADATPQSVLAWDLGPGESAVLACALARPGAEVVIDELAGRRCATSHALLVSGCLGLALAAKTRGEIVLARPVIEDLSRSGLYLSAALMQNALALVGE